MTQVVIVGAGPAGATLALLLVQRNITVKLIEATRTFRRMFRGEGLMPSGLHALEQMGLSSLLERVPHRPLNAWEFIIDNQFLFRVDEPIEPDGQPCTLVSQPALLEALVDEASIYPNFELVQSTQVQDLLWSDQRVSGVKLSDGRKIIADLVIGADGRNSTVRQRANLLLEQQTKSLDILWFKLADSPRFESENVFYSILHGRHAFGLFRSSEGNLQVGWTLHAEDTFDEAKSVAPGGSIRTDWYACGSPTGNVLENVDWKQIDWSKMLASASPPWLAEHFRTHSETIERPILLSVVVGRCPKWSIPGLLLLGDAAHPMSPIRAQGINMALRDVLVAANHLVPELLNGSGQATLDAALPRIQAEREPEIVRAQQLQAEEASQAEQLRKSVLLRRATNLLAPLLRKPVRQSWLSRQRQLRQGIAPIQLTV